MIVQSGSIDVTTYFTLRTAADGTATTGATITNIDLQYCRSGAAPAAKVDATALAAVDSIHGANKAFEVDGTDQPGLYRVDWPDAAFASGVREVILTVKLASSFTEHLRVELSPAVNVVAIDDGETAATNLKTAGDNYSATRGLTGTALPAAAADAGGGVPISDAGNLDLDTKLANTNEITVARMGALTDWINGGRLDLLLDAIPTTAMRGTDSAALAATALSDAVWTNAKAAFIDAAISSRSSHAAADIWTAGSRALSTPNDYKADVSALALAATALTDATWTDAKAAFLDAAISGRSSHSAADVWAAVTRTLTANTNLNDPTAAAIVTAWRAITPTAGGVATYDDMMLALYAYCRGQIDKTGDAYEYQDDDDSTGLFTLTAGATQRTTA